MHTTPLPQKTFSRHKVPLSPYPSLAEIQTSSYEWLVKEGVAELLKEFSPISDYTGKKFDLFLLTNAPYTVPFLNPQLPDKSRWQAQHEVRGSRSSDSALEPLPGDTLMRLCEPALAA